MEADIISAKPADAAYRSLSPQPFIEGVFLLLWLAYDVRPLLRRTRAIGLRGMRQHPMIWLQWCTVLSVLAFIGLWLACVGLSAYDFERAITLPTKDIREHPGEFEKVAATMEWARTTAALTRWQGYVALAALFLLMFLTLFGTQFHPKMFILVDTIVRLPESASNPCLRSLSDSCLIAV